MSFLRLLVAGQDWCLNRLLFRYRRGAVVGYGPTKTRCVVVWQRYQTREVLEPLVTYHVEFADGHSCWVSETDLGTVGKD